MDLEQALRELPNDAPEAMVEHLFSKPLLHALGFTNTEIFPQFPLSRGSVDQAARKNNDHNDIFLQTRKKPFLYIEAKGRKENLTEGHKDYVKATAQLKGYLLDSQSKSVKWGILTNSSSIQLFRKHGKIIYPATPCMPLNDATKLVKNFKKKIEQPKRALVIAIYNNKGGVGKTTTTLNLAALFTLLNKKVLAIDFDPNQSDLGDALNMDPTQGRMVSILENKGSDIRDIITPYFFEHPKLKNAVGFDLVLADEELGSDIDEVRLRQKVKPNALLNAIEFARDDYDYILIDTPPNWRIFSQRALYAADVILIPARHDNLHSLQNAAAAVTQYIPEVQRERRKYGEAGPIALPIFMNNSTKETDAQVRLMHEAIAEIIGKFKKDGHDLTSFFYPKMRPGRRDLRMYTIPRMAYISRADFLHVPAVFTHKKVCELYLSFAKEYFLQ